MKEKSYLLQTASWLRSVAVMSVCGIASAVCAQNTAPLKPVNLSADADYNKVVLTWEDPVSTEELLSEDFEGAFPAEGWSLKTTNTDYYMNTWFQFPSAEMEEEGVDDESRSMFVHGGKKSALLYPDMNTPHEDGSSAWQNEWLYLPATPGAEYVSFYTYINPEILNYAESEDFPDHYYVKVSHDNGATWNVLWDGRSDISTENAFQYVNLYLGDASKGAPIVAFHATGNENDPETGLYFAWAIDDVKLSKRLFAEGADKNAVATEAYNVYLDNELIAENVRKSTYTDLSNKEPGSHLYAVEAVSNTFNLKSDKVEKTVEIKEPILNSPTNLNVKASKDEASGKYNVLVTWDKPEGDRTPAYYTVRCNNALAADFMEDREIEQTGKPKGVYTYSVYAVYEYPSGTSEPIEMTVAAGTRLTASDFSAAYDGKNVVMSWKAPSGSEYPVKDYCVYRGNEKLTETSETSFTAANEPEGQYDYSVKVVYNDGFESLPVTKTLSRGTKPAYTLPFSEDFTGGLTPGNWVVEKVDGKMQDQYLWRFDNWFELPVSGGGFSGEFASVASSVAGYTNIFTTLDTPPVVRGEVADGTKTYIEFDMDYMEGGKSSSASLHYSYNGEEWASIEDFGGYLASDLTGGEICKPVHKKIDVTEYFTDSETPVYFAWKYNGKLANHLAIDNVKIYNDKATGISVVGEDREYSINGNTLNINGSSVTGVKVFAADGTCVADVPVNGEKKVALPLGAGVNIISVSTTAGTQTIKICR